MNFIFFILILILLAAFMPRGIPNTATLNSQLAQADGTDHALLAVNTNVGSGTLYYIIDTNCSIPSAGQIQAGQNAAGAAAVVSGNQTVSLSGQQTANPSGTSAVTTYCAFFNQKTSANSNVVGVNNFVTPGTISWSNTFTAAWNANVNAAAYTAVVTNVQTVLTNCLTALGNITIKQQWDFQSTPGALGTTTVSSFTNSYSTIVRPALLALPNQNKIQSTAYGNMPGAEPTGSGDTMSIACAQGAATINTTLCGIISQWGSTIIDSGTTFDTKADGSTNNGNVSLWDVVMHEQTETMGRSYTKLDVATNVTILDEFSFSAAGTRNVTTTGTRYPSHDLGTTNVISANTLNQNPAGDAGDETIPPSTYLTAFNYNYSGAALSPLLAQDIKFLTLASYGLSHSCRLSAGISWP